MFYLRSRGLPEPQARQLLTAAFCRDALANIEIELREPLAQAVDGALARLGEA
jgi:Fe-S cluster assembly protein SufD